MRRTLVFGILLAAAGLSARALAYPPKATPKGADANWSQAQEERGLA